MDYACGKFGNCIFSRFGSIQLLRDTQTDADERFAPAILVGVNKYRCKRFQCETQRRDSSASSSYLFIYYTEAAKQHQNIKGTHTKKQYAEIKQ